MWSSKLVVQNLWTIIYGDKYDELSLTVTFTQTIQAISAIIAPTQSGTLQSHSVTYTTLMCPDFFTTWSDE